MSYLFSGTHVICDLYGIKEDLCLNGNICKPLVENAIYDAGAHVIKTIVYTFDSGGFTLLSLLKESHVSLHTYPESKSAFIDVFTCGNTNPQKIINELITYFKPDNYEMKKIVRGIKKTSS